MFACQRPKNDRQLNIRYNYINIKQYWQVTNLGCVSDETMPGEPVALKVINKMNGKLKFLYRKNRYLTKELHIMLYKPLIQPHFDYACLAWYPNLNEIMKRKIQVMQNKCIRFYLTLDKMHHISKEEFRLINWLPTSKTVDQCIKTTASITLALTIGVKFLNSPYIVGQAHEIILINLHMLFSRLTWDEKQFLILVPVFRTAFLTQLKKRIV